MLPEITASHPSIHPIPSPPTLLHSNSMSIFYLFSPYFSTGEVQDHEYLKGTCHCVPTRLHLHTLPHAQIIPKQRI